MAEFFSSRLLRWLIVPYRSRLVNMASRPFYQVADRVLGSQFLEDLAEFFILFQTMRDGFVARADAVGRLLKDARTTFVIVTTLEAVPALEAQQLIDSLSERRLHLGLLVCNRVLPAAFSDPDIGRTAEQLGARASELATLTGPAVEAALEAATRGGAAPPSPETIARVIDEVARSFGNFRLVATREGELLQQLSAAHEVTATVPYHPGHVTDLRGLLDVGGRIWGDAPAPADRAPRRARPAARRGPKAAPGDADGGGASTSSTGGGPTGHRRKA